MPRRLAPLTALVAVALLIGGVAYAIVPDTGSVVASSATTATSVPGDDSTTSIPDSSSTSLAETTATSIAATTSTTSDESSASTLAGRQTSTTIGSTSTSTATAQAQTRTYEAAGIGTLTVAFDGTTVSLVRVDPAPGWTHSVDEITTRNIEIDFWNGSVRHRAKVEVEDGDLRFEHFEK